MALYFKVRIWVRGDASASGAGSHPRATSKNFLALKEKQREYGGSRQKDEKNFEVANSVYHLSLHNYVYLVLGS